ncbi:hypothetical protein B4134_0331 [Bacillus safensis]|nr:hypothetical protein B4134_0331 [Bacillus safensis]
MKNSSLHIRVKNGKVSHSLYHIGYKVYFMPKKSKYLAQ